MKHGPFFCGYVFLESGDECHRQSLFSRRSARSISGNSPPVKCSPTDRRARCRLARADIDDVAVIRFRSVSQRLPARDHSSVVERSSKVAVSGQDRHTKVVPCSCFLGGNSMAGLRYHSHGRLRQFRCANRPSAEGRSNWLNFLRKILSFSIPNRFIPAHPDGFDVPRFRHPRRDALEAGCKHTEDQD